MKFKKNPNSCQAFNFKQLKYPYQISDIIPFNFYKIFMKLGTNSF